MKASSASSISEHRSPEDTIPSDRFPSVTGLIVHRNAADTEPALPARDSLPTTPYGRGSVVALLSAAERMRLLDEQTTDSGRPMPEWCADLGHCLQALTTFDLWMALARGELSRKTRVWRDGMDAWTPVEDIPELALAVADSVSFDPPLVTPAPLATLPPMRVAEVRTPLTFEAATEASTGDPPNVGDPNSANIPSEPIAIPIRSFPSLRRVREGFVPSRRGALQFAAGCAVAALALATAFVRTGGNLPVASAQGENARVVLQAGLGEVTTEAGRSVLEASAREPAPNLAPPPPIARHHHEPGQRRSRRSPQR
ncbi:DUF4339 domain-containing protein [Polyangium aurulentum]|uniref:DUF4339 domain-containing protein n=1 Tax=Polyangium aurulentum TaxID=2567896 RepID=UPI00146BB23E|nr:DUF4339 domain-containing protein [Polyangium aurulentum]UQA61498.1 DUF4339 domain-containing protein [Polyangium aurulentum]